MDVWDVRLNQGHEVEFTLPGGRTLAVVVLRGNIEVNNQEAVHEAQVAVLDRDQQGFILKSKSDARLLVLSGEPLDEPIVGYGPFVMNDEAGIHQAIQDFNSGRFGRISAADARA
jgi:redox-sensitive bicupin YhaK (pirin superfamily)